MVDDIILKVKKVVKQTFCIHTYRYDSFAIHGCTKWYIYECQKCRKIKSENMGK